MAKATRYGGDSYTEHELSDPTPPVVIRRAVLGEVDKPFPGSNYIQSSESESTEKSSQKQSHLPPALTTESLSEVQEVETDSTAHSTAGDGQIKTAKQSGKKVTTKRARASQVSEDEFDEFE